MLRDIYFFMYVFAGFAGVMAVLLLVFLIKYWSTGNKKLLVAANSFLICTLLIDLLYFYYEYVTLKNGSYTAGAVTRILDIGLFIGEVYFWAAYVREKSMLHENVRSKMAKSTAYLLAACLLSAILCYGFLIDNGYSTQPGVQRNIAIIIELFLCVVLSAINIWHLKTAMGEVLQSKARKYIILISLLIILNGTWNAVLMIILLNGRSDTFTNIISDPTSIFILLINVCTFILITSEDFDVLFKAGRTDTRAFASEAEDAAGDEKRRLSNRLDMIAEQHFLTEREREVMELAYMKMTNPEIADKLCISKYTVKNHMHNIFEKLDISTRSDLVLLVDKEQQTILSEK